MAVWLIAYTIYDKFSLFKDLPESQRFKQALKRCDPLKFLEIKLVDVEIAYNSKSKYLEQRKKQEKRLTLLNTSVIKSYWCIFSKQIMAQFKPTTASFSN